MDIAIYENSVWSKNDTVKEGTVRWPDGKATLGVKQEDFPLTNGNYTAYLRVFQATRNDRFQVKSGTTFALVDNKHTITETVADLDIETAKSNARKLVLQKREAVLATPYTLKDEFDPSILRSFETTENQLSRMDRIAFYLDNVASPPTTIEYPESNGEVFTITVTRFDTIIEVISQQELAAYKRQQEIVTLIDDEDVDTIAELDAIMDAELETGWPR